MKAKRSGLGAAGWITGMVIGAVGLVCAALPATAAAETNITIGGTGCALGTMKQLAAVYEKSHPGIRIKIMPSLGSTAGIKAVLGGGIDLALASRPLTETERTQGAREVEYARTPFMFITNAKVNKKDVSIRELEGIYSNPAATWPDGSRIRLILRPEKDIDTKLLRDLSPAMDRAVTSAHARPGMIRAITDQESTDAVAQTPGALGAATLTEIVSEKRPVNVLSYNGVPATVRNIAGRSYPLVKSLYLVTTPKSPAAARRFAVFVCSPAARAILTRNGNLAVTAQ
ncbi:MAG: substrate-binding domain-containing protein [Geobacteraceae bacterium]|nr:substrate-binding domain-containing protein [Geobacteraceae bacterium]